MTIAHPWAEFYLGYLHSYPQGEFTSALLVPSENL